MAVAVDTNSHDNADAVGVTSLNLTTFTVGATSDRALIVFLGWDRTTITGVTGNWDTAGTPQALTQVVAKDAADASTRVEIWGRLSPTSGNKTLNFSWTGAAELLVTLVSFQGVDQGAVGTSFVHAATDAASTANPSIAVTSAANNYTAATVNAANDVPAFATQTLVQGMSGAGNANTSSSIAAGAATVTHGWTVSAVPWAACGCDIVALGAAGGGGLTAAQMAGIFAVPRGKVFPLELRGSVDASEFWMLRDTQFAGPAQFKTYDYPNPRSKEHPRELRTFTNPSETHLIGKDLQFGAAGQFETYDWPNPRGKAHPHELRTFLNPTETHLIGKDVFFAGAGKAPVYDWPNPIGKKEPSDLRSSWLQNLQESTLVPIGAAPFALKEWPAPPARVVAISARTHAFWFTDDGQAVPCALTEWPNPRGKDHPASLRTWTESRDPFLVDLSPFALTEWPNPRSKDYPIALRTFLDGRKAFHVDAMAFNQDDWLNPAARRSADLLTAWIQNLLSDALAPATASPFLPGDWSLPRIAAPLAITQRTALFWYAIDDSAPFAMSDWPLPVGKAFPAALRTWTDGKRTYLTTGPDPFAMSDWPLPGSKVFPVGLRTFLDGRKAFHVDAMAFSQDDWPVPLAKEHARALRTFADFRREYLAEVLPFRLSEWPNPLPPRALADLRYAALGLLTSTLAPGPMPFALSDWPLPRGPQAARELRTFVDDMRRELLGQDRFYGAPGEVPAYDWPNPRGRQYPVSLIDFFRRNPRALDALADVIGAIECTGSYAPIVDLSGSYAPTLDLPGRVN